MRNGLLKKLMTAGTLTVAMTVVPSALSAQGGATVVKAADMAKLMPASVFYRGQVATTQLRNSGGVKFGDGFFVLASLVDTSGYSNAIASKYQAYFIAEVPIKVGGKSLAAGAYGIGFVAGNKFVVTDVGGHDVLNVNDASDADMKRPMPLQVLAGPNGGFRLYAGRQYVVLTR